MSEQFPAPSSNTSYGEDLATATENYRQNRYADGSQAMISYVPGMTSAEIADAPSQQELIEFPYYATSPDRGASYVQKMPDEQRLGSAMTISKMRERFGYIDHLNDSETDHLLSFVGGIAQSRLKEGQPYDVAKAVHEVIDATNYSLRTEVHRGSNDAHFIPAEKTVSLDPDRLRAEAVILSDRLVARGVELKHPNDALLANTIHVLSHEMGHGVGTTMAQRAGNGKGWSKMLHKAYLAERPQEAFTGLIDSDANIHDERFADGYSRVIMMDILAGLGYSYDEAKRFFDVLHQAGIEHGGNIEGKAVKHVELVEPAREENVSVGMAALKAFGIAAPDIMYEGNLGYGDALDEDQVVSVFAFYADKLQNGVDISAQEYNATSWREAVDAAHNNDVHPKLRQRIDAHKVA